MDTKTLAVVAVLSGVLWVRPAFGIIAGPPQTVIKRLGTWQR